MQFAGQGREAASAINLALIPEGPEKLYRGMDRAQLRDRVVAAIDRGLSCRAAAVRLPPGPKFWDRGLLRSASDLRKIGDSVHGGPQLI